MKRIAALLLAALMVVSLAACGKNTDTPSTAEGQDAQNPDYTVEELMDKVMENVDIPFALAATPVQVSGEDSDYYLGLTAGKDLVEDEATVMEPMMSAQAFSAAIVKLKDVKDAGTVKEEMLNGVNMDKWICVSADYLIVTDNGSYVLMVMGPQEYCEAVADSFDSVLVQESGERLIKDTKIDEQSGEESEEENDAQSGTESDAQTSGENTAPSKATDKPAQGTNTGSSSSGESQQNTPSADQPVQAPQNPDYTAEELMGKVMGNVSIPFSLAATPMKVSDENSDYYFGLTASKSLVEDDAVVMEPMMSAQAFSAAIVKLKDAKNAGTVKNEMLNGVNMSKWICVSADYLIVVDNGDYVLMVMGAQEHCEAVANAFDSVLVQKSGKRLITDAQIDLTEDAQASDNN